METENKKRSTSATRESQKEKCVFCGKRAELKLDNGKYICDNCAQIQSELGNDEELD